MFRQFSEANFPVCQQTDHKNQPITQICIDKNCQQQNRFICPYCSSSHSNHILEPIYEYLKKSFQHFFSKSQELNQKKLKIIKNNILKQYNDSCATYKTIFKENFQKISQIQEQELKQLEIYEKLFNLQDKFQEKLMPVSTDYGMTAEEMNEFLNLSFQLTEFQEKFKFVQLKDINEASQLNSFKVQDFAKFEEEAFKSFFEQNQQFDQKIINVFTFQHSLPKKIFQIQLPGILPASHIILIKNQILCLVQNRSILNLIETERGKLIKRMPLNIFDIKYSEKIDKLICTDNSGFLYLLCPFSLKCLKKVQTNFQQLKVYLIKGKNKIILHNNYKLLVYNTKLTKKVIIYDLMSQDMEDLNEINQNQLLLQNEQDILNQQQQNMQMQQQIQQALVIPQNLMNIQQIIQLQQNEQQQMINNLFENNIMNNNQQNFVLNNNNNNNNLQQQQIAQIQQQQQQQQFQEQQNIFNSLNIRFVGTFQRNQKLFLVVQNNLERNKLFFEEISDDTTDSHNNIIYQKKHEISHQFQKAKTCQQIYYLDRDFLLFIFEKHICLYETKNFCLIHQQEIFRNPFNYYFVNDRFLYYYEQVQTRKRFFLIDLEKHIKKYIQEELFQFPKIEPLNGILFFEGGDLFDLKNLQKIEIRKSLNINNLIESQHEILIIKKY